jgi:hypothetical protein
VFCGRSTRHGGPQRTAVESQEKTRGADAAPLARGTRLALVI